MRKRNKIIENPLSSISSMYSQNRSNRKMWMLLPINDNLKFLEKNNRLSLINKNCYRGSRAKKGLPIRGQRTRSNAQTCRRMIRFWKNIK
jgi:ribosomal protein S13